MTLTLRFLIVIWTLSVLCIILQVIKEPTCYKDPDKPACIDLILTNSSRQFKTTLALETALSDFYKIAVAAFKSEFPYQKPKKIAYRNCKHFDRNNFDKEIKIILITLAQRFSSFKKIVFEALNLYTPLKIKFLRVRISVFCIGQNWETNF